MIKQERLNCCKPASIHERSKLLIRLSLCTKIYIKHTKVDNCMSDKLHGISNKKCQKPCKTQKQTPCWIERMQEANNCNKPYTPKAQF